jgi:hypothetical protein
VGPRTGESEGCCGRSRGRQPPGSRPRRGPCAGRHRSVPSTDRVRSNTAAPAPSPERLWCGPSLRDLLAAPHAQHASPHDEHDLHACCPLSNGTLGRRPGVTSSTGVTGGVSIIVNPPLRLLRGRSRRVEPRQKAADTESATAVPVRRATRRVPTRRFGFCTGSPGAIARRITSTGSGRCSARCHEGLTSRDTPTRTGDITFRVSTRRQPAPVTTVFICARRILG